ncbi:unnamed protein product [Natator depressus]
MQPTMVFISLSLLESLARILEDPKKVYESAPLLSQLWGRNIDEGLLQLRLQPHVTSLFSSSKELAKDLCQRRKWGLYAPNVICKRHHHQVTEALIKGESLAEGQPASLW